ncbi:MAG TPA: GNAT family protein [Nocardioides sp.]|nr:GNAT family protein [Nocardioides sp.]
MTNPDVSWPQHTERLLLRKVTEDDIDRLLEFRNKPDVYQWLMETVVDPDKFRAGWMKSLTDPRDHSTVVELDGVVIGTAYLEVEDALGQDKGEPTLAAEAHIGYIFDPAYAGQGYATETTAELLRISFEVLRVHRVYAGCYADNLASRRVLEKVGMQLEQYGVRDSWHAELGWLDGCTYALLEDEWFKGGAARAR